MIKELEWEKERQRGTQCNSLIPKDTTQEWHYPPHHELHYKANVNIKMRKLNKQNWLSWTTIENTEWWRE